MLYHVHIERWERNRFMCFFTYIHLDLFHSRPSILYVTTWNHPILWTGVLFLIYIPDLVQIYILYYTYYYDNACILLHYIKTGFYLRWVDLSTGRFEFNWYTRKSAHFNLYYIYLQGGTYLCLVYHEIFIGQIDKSSITIKSKLTWMTRGLRYEMKQRSFIDTLPLFIFDTYFGTWTFICP